PLTPPPPTPPTFTLDGRPIEIRSALVVAEDDEVAVRVTNFPLSCEEELAGARPSYDDEVALHLRLGRQLRPDGRLLWAVRGSYFAGSSSESLAGGDALPGVEIDTTAGAKGRLTVDLTHKTLAIPDAPAQTLVLRGDVEVVGCGPRPAYGEEPAPPKPQPDAFITIAGKPLPIVGAGIVTTPSGRSLMISTSPVECVEGLEHAASRGDVLVELVWDDGGKLIRATRDGAWIGWGANQRQPIGLSATPNRPPAGAKQLELTLDGSTTISDYPVALSGKVRAIVCPPSR
ncbi:MAG: hypothetical protein KC731_04900, partial [Myxococcales bacterium]|nr:hypothetical protein [Myxococcales bacterium]